MDRVPAEILLTLLELQISNFPNFTLPLVSRRLYSLSRAYKPHLIRLFFSTRITRPRLTGHILILTVLPEGLWHPTQRASHLQSICTALDSVLAPPHDVDPWQTLPEDTILAAYQIHRRILYLARKQYGPCKNFPKFIDQRQECLIGMYEHFIKSHVLLRDIRWRPSNTDKTSPDVQRIRALLQPLKLLDPHWQSWQYLTESRLHFGDGNRNGGKVAGLIRTATWRVFRLVDLEERKDGMLLRTLHTAYTYYYNYPGKPLMADRNQRRIAAECFMMDAGLGLVVRLFEQNDENKGWGVWRDYAREVEMVYGIEKMKEG